MVSMHFSDVFMKSSEEHCSYASRYLHPWSRTRIAPELFVVKRFETHRSRLRKKRDLIYAKPVDRDGDGEER